MWEEVECRPYGWRKGVDWERRDGHDGEHVREADDSLRIRRVLNQQRLSNQQAVLFLNHGGAHGIDTGHLNCALFRVYQRPSVTVGRSCCTPSISRGVEAGSLPDKSFYDFTKLGDACPRSGVFRIPHEYLAASLQIPSAER